MLYRMHNGYTQHWQTGSKWDIVLYYLAEWYMVMFLHRQWYRQWLQWLPTNNSCSGELKKKLIWHELHWPRLRININFVSNLTHITTILKLSRTYILYFPLDIQLDHHASYYGFFLIKPPPYLPLIPEAHLTHQHKEKWEPPLSTAAHLWRPPRSAQNDHTATTADHCETRPTPGHQCCKAQPLWAYTTT